MDIPNTKEQAVWEPVLSDNLMRLIVLGDQAEARWADKNKKEPAPPLFEGDLFSSMTEGAHEFDGVACDTADGKSVCTASLHVVSKNKDGKNETFRWRDKLDLVDTAAGWRVDDLNMAAPGISARKASSATSSNGSTRNPARITSRFI